MLFRSYGLPAVLLLIAILAAVIRINRRLSSEISRRIALEQELRSSEYHYRGLIESLSAIAWEADANDFTYSYVSPHAEDLLGYPLHDWLKPGFWRSILHPDDARRAIDAMMEADLEYEQAHLALKDLHSIQAEYHVDQLKRTCSRAQNVAIKSRMYVFRALEKYIGSVEPSEAMDALYRMDADTHYHVMCLMSDPTVRQ